MVPADAVSTRGAMLEYDRMSADHSSTYRLCGECHSRLYSTTTRRPGIATVRAGTLDRSEELECVAHIFTASKQGWFPLPEGAPAFPDMPPPEAIKAIWG